MRLGLRQIPELVPYVKLMHHAHMSVNRAEEMHGQTSAVKRYHKTMSPDVIMQRTFALFMLPYIRCPREDARDRAIDNRVEVLKAKQPNKINHYNIHVRDMLSSTFQYLPENANTFDATSSAVAMLGPLCKLLSNDDVDTNARRADHLRRERVISINDELAALRKEKAARAEKRADDEKLNGSSGTLTHLRFGGPELDTLGLLWHGPQARGNMLYGARAQALIQPVIPLIEERSNLVSQPYFETGEPKLADHPWWLRILCLGRDHFPRCILSFDFPSGRRYFFFLLAKQQPYQVTFLELDLVDEPLPVLQLPPALSFAARGTPRHTFRPVPMEFAQEHSLPATEGVAINVFQGAWFGADGMVFAEMDTIPLKDLAVECDLDGDRMQARRTRADDEDEQLAKLVKKGVHLDVPWLEAATTERIFDKKPASKKRNLDDAEVGDALGEAEVENIQAELAQLRLEYRERHGEDAGAGFAVVYRGGNWTGEHLGVSWGSVRAHARNAKVESFCRKCSFRLSRTYSRFEYGDDWSTKLATRWAQVLNHYWAVRFRSGSNPVYDFSPTDRATLDLHFEALVDALPHASPVRDAAAQLRELFPRRV